MTKIITTSKAYKAARAKLGDYRKSFESLDDAMTTVKAIFATESFPADFPVVAARVGQIDVSGEDTIPPLSEWPAEYGDGSLVCVSFIGVRGLEDESGKTVNGAQGFAIYPLHPLDAIQSDESGMAWLWKIAEKEASHVAFRRLRNVPEGLGVDGLAAAAMQMPISVSDYVEESTSEALDTSAFSSLWKDFRKLLAESPSTASLVPALPGKADVIKCIRSKAFALAEYEDLEKAGAFRFIAETMATMIDRMRENAIEAGEEYDLDSGQIKAWLAGRDTKEFAAPKRVEADLSKVDFGAFMAAAIPAATDGEDEEGEEGADEEAATK